MCSKTVSSLHSIVNLVSLDTMMSLISTVTAGIPATKDVIKHWKIPGHAFLAIKPDGVLYFTFTGIQRQ